MRYLMITMAALLLAAGGRTAALSVSERSDEWEITIKYGDSMAGQGETRSGEECAFIWEFSEGRKGVMFLGSDATVNLNDIWNTQTATKPGTRAGDRNSGDARPELVVLLSIKIDPTNGDELHLRTAVTRWGLVALPPPYDYRFETDVLESELKTGEAWQFLGGRGPDGKEYFLEMTIEPAGNGARTAVRSKPRTVPIRFDYRLVTPAKDGQAEFQTEREMVLSENEEPVPVEIDAPIDIPGIDSSMLRIEIKLNNIFLREAGGPDQYEIDAVFALERWLLIDIKPSADTTQMNLSQMISSSYNHAIHLKPNKKVRIEIPDIEGGKYDLNAREIIEIEPVVAEKKPE